MSIISNLLETEKKQYDEKSLKTNPSYAPRQQDILELIDSYWVSKFRDGDGDTLGFKKTFFNITNLPVETSAKSLDLDTKDIRIIAEDWASYWASWLMTKELKMWMKNKYFGRQLNAYALNYPKYGHIIVKKVDDDVELVPIQNIIIKPDAKDIKNTPIIEKHIYTPDGLKKEAKDRGWDIGVAEDIAKNPDDDGNLLIYEIYAPKDLVEGEEDNYFITSESGDKELFSAKKNECPYKDLVWEHLEGRLLGRGQAEKLFEEQIYLNRIANYKAEGLHWTSKHFFQTRDTGIASNLMTNSENGEIFIVNDELKVVPMEERNLQIYAQEETRWEENALKRTFTREPLTGGRAPSGTPLGSTILQTQQAMSFFEQKKEDLGMFIKEILWDWILPEFKNQNRKEHKILMKNILEGDEDNSEKFFQLKLNSEMSKLRARTAKYLSPDQWKIREANIAEVLKNTEITIPKGFYDNLKYKIDIVITGEQVDTSQKINTLQTVLQMIGSNPTILQDKRTRKIFYKMLDLAGYNPNDLQITEEPQSMASIAGEQRAQVGGSIAKPLPAQMPAQAQTQTKV